MRRLLTTLKLGIVGLALSLIPAAAEDSIINIPTDDPAMVAATERAQTSLDDFLALTESPPDGAGSFTLKVAITDNGQTEHFWILPFRREGDDFVGTISNTPMVVTNVTEGAEYQFSRADVSDWGYSLDGKLHGYFTLRAMLSHMSEEDAAQYQAMLAEE